MNEHDTGQPEQPEIPEGAEIVENGKDFLSALALKCEPLQAVEIGVGVIDASYSTLKAVAGPFGEMAILQALTTAMMNPDIESGFRVALIRAAMIAEALEGEKSPAELAADFAERFGQVEELTNFEDAREAWRAMKEMTTEATAEVDALEAAFALPDADEPNTEKGENDETHDA